MRGPLVRRANSALALPRHASPRTDSASELPSRLQRSWLLPDGYTPAGMRTGCALRVVRSQSSRSKRSSSRCVSTASVRPSGAHAVVPITRGSANSGARSPVRVSTTHDSRRVGPAYVGSPKLRL